jgi:tRNA A-37 threonylcarbamoyl transferase component Bud32
MKLNIQTFCPGDRDFVSSVSETVFSSYDGRGRDWHPDPKSGIWPIHMAVRAGVVGIEQEGRRVCVKLFYDRSLKSRLRNLLRCSKAKKAWRCGLALVAGAVPVPGIIGYAEDGSGTGLMITELVEDAVRLDIRIQQHGSTEPEAERLGQFIRRMHDAGVTHKDLSLRNILVRNGEGGFLLLDYEDACFSKTVSEQDRLYNLHHLHERAIGAAVSEPVRRAFLAGYLEDARLTARWCEKLQSLIQLYPSKYTAECGCPDELTQRK